MCICKGHLRNKEDAVVNEIMKFIDEKEAARITGIAVQTLRNYRQKSKGPAYCKVGSSIRYFLPDLQEFMLKCRIDPSTRV